MPSGQAISDMQKVGERSIFIQEGGNSPASQPRYRGASSFGGWNLPQGDVNPIHLPAPDAANQWDIVDMTQGAPGLPTSDFTVRCNIPIYRLWRTLIKARCPVNAVILYDSCGRKDDLNSWEYALIYEQTRFTDFSDSAINPLDGDDQAPVELSGSVSALREIEIFPLRFEEVADAALLADAVDGFYATDVSCGGKCGSRRDECNNLYVLQEANTGSPGLSSQLLITTDDKQTFDALDIPTLGGAKARRMTDAGSYIIVVSQADDAHHVIRKSDADDLLPGGWSRISSTKYVGVLWSIWAKSPSEIYIGGNAGYAYKLTNATGAPTVLTDGSIVTDNLTEVHGFGSTVVFAGLSGKVLVSTNDGGSFEEKAISVDGVAIVTAVSALQLISPSTWFLASEGVLYFTEDTGTTYTIKVLAGDVQIINSIRFNTPSVGYLSAQMLGTTPRVYRTFTAGFNWEHDSPALTGLPNTAERYTFVAPCGSNEVAAGGRLSAGGDGVLAIAV